MGSFEVNASAPGLLHYVVVPTAMSHNMSAQDIWANNQSLAVLLLSTDVQRVNLTDLTPHVTYDLWLVTEVHNFLHYFMVWLL